jgi:hypothetical protein
MIVTNDGACGIFGPFCLPIVGVYDDYGTITDIQESVTTRLLEAQVGDVSAWLSNVDDDMIGRHGSSKPDLAPDAMMFIHGDVYEFMTRPDSDNSMLTESFATYYALEELGFVKPTYEDEIKPEDMVDPNGAHGMKRYNRPWKHESSDRFYICSDGGKFLIIAEKTDAGWVDREHIYKLKDLGKVWKKHTGHAFDLAKYKDIPASDYRTRSTIAEYEGLLERDKRLFKKENNEHPYRVTFGSHDTEFMWGLRLIDAGHLFDLYGPVLVGDESGRNELASELSRFKTFLGNMYRANKLLMPAMNGPQFGDEKYVRDLSRKVAQICAATIKRHKE